MDPQDDNRTRRADRNVMLGLFAGAAAVLLVGAPVALGSKLPVLAEQVMATAVDVAAASVVDQLDDLAWTQEAAASSVFDADADARIGATRGPAPAWPDVDEALAVAAVGAPERAEGATPEAAPPKTSAARSMRTSPGKRYYTKPTEGASRSESGRARGVTLPPSEPARRGG